MRAERLREGCEVEGDVSARYRVVIVARPRVWRPDSPGDVPPASSRVVEAVEELVSAEWIRQYNAMSLADGGTTWAVVPWTVPAVE